MNKLSVLVVVVALLFAGQALAADEYTVVYPCIDYCCTFECVSIDPDCTWCCSTDNPLHVEFLDYEDNVLGTAVFTGDWCCGQSTAMTDQPVNSQDICKIRVSKSADDCSICWMSIRAFCDERCSCGKWRMLWKGDVWCWEMVPEPTVTAQAVPQKKMIKS